MKKLDQSFKKLGVVPTTDLSKINSAYVKTRKIWRPEWFEPNTGMHKESLAIKEAYDYICTHLKSLAGSKGKTQKPIFPPANVLEAVRAASIAIVPLKDKMNEMRKLLPKSLQKSCAPAFAKLDELSKELSKVHYWTHKYVKTEELKYRRESRGEKLHRLNMESSDIDPADIDV